MGRQRLDDANNVVPYGFRWGLAQSVTLSGSVQKVFLSGQNRDVRVSTDAQGATVLLGSSAGTLQQTFTLIAFQTLGSSGSGYTVGDSITLSGGSSTASAKLTVASTSGGGAITSVTISAAGMYTSVPANAVAQGTTTGTGTGAGFNVSWGSNQWNIPPNTVEKFAVSPGDAIGLIQLGTAGAVTVSEGLSPP